MPPTYKLHYLLAMKLGSGGETIVSHGQKSQHGSTIFTLLASWEAWTWKSSHNLSHITLCSSMIFTILACCLQLEEQPQSYMAYVQGHWKQIIYSSFWLVLHSQILYLPLRDVNKCLTTDYQCLFSTSSPKPGTFLVHDITSLFLPVAL